MTVTSELDLVSAKMNQYDKHLVQGS